MQVVAEKRIIDWESVEREYCAGVRSLRSIADEFGIAESGIRKKASKDGWDRNLEARIKAKADVLVRKNEARKASAHSIDKATEKQIIEVNANIQAAIQLRQRGRIQKHQDLGEKLLAELEAQTEGLEDFEKLAELMKSDAGFDKLNELYKKVIATPSRIDSFKKLSESLKTLVGLERQAFGMADNSNGDADKKNNAFSAMTIDDIQREREAINARRTVR